LDAHKDLFLVRGCLELRLFFYVQGSLQLDLFFVECKVLVVGLKLLGKEKCGIKMCLQEARVDVDMNGLKETDSIGRDCGQGRPTCPQGRGKSRVRWAGKGVFFSVCRQRIEKWLVI
jgi:hypothetical protein